MLAAVHQQIMNARDGQANLHAVGSQLRHRPQPHVLVLQRHQRHFHTCHAPQQRPPNSAGQHNGFSVDAALISDDGAHFGAAYFDCGNGGLAVEAGCPVQAGCRCHGCARHHCVAYARARVKQAAMQFAGVQQRIARLALARIEQVRLQPEGLGPTGAALQFLPALCRAGHLQPADQRRALLLLKLQLRIQRHTVARKLRQHARAADAAQPAGRMAGGSAGVKQGALVQHHNIAPAAQRQMVGHAAAGNAGSDNHDACLGLHQ